MPERAIPRLSSDPRTHIERINDPEPQENTMTPEQFDELKAMLADFLTPVRDLALRQMAWMDAEEARRGAYEQTIAEAQPVFETELSPEPDPEEPPVG